MLPLLLLLVLVGGFSPHVWHDVRVNYPSTCQIAQVFENASLFVDQHNDSVQTFVADPEFQFGLILLPNASFNMIYSLTCRNQTCIAYPKPCPRVLFVISANGPAAPIVSVVGFFGGNGSSSIQKPDILVLDVVF